MHVADYATHYQLDIICIYRNTVQQYPTASIKPSFTMVSDPLVRIIHITSYSQSDPRLPPAVRSYKPFRYFRSKATQSVSKYDQTVIGKRTESSFLMQLCV